MLLLVITSLAVSAQTAKVDKIYKADNSVIDCKIIEVTESAIKYKKATYLDGPTYSIAVSEVVTIQFANGDSQVFGGQVPKAAATPSPAPATKTQTVAASSAEASGQGSAHKASGFSSYEVNGYFPSGGTYLGGSYNFYWHIGRNDLPSDMYLGFGIQGFYGFGTTGSYGNMGTVIDPYTGEEAQIDISGGTLSSSVFYVPIHLRFFPSASNFYVEAQAGPALNLWKWSGNNSYYGYASDNGLKFTFAPGVVVGYSINGLDISARWNKDLGVGVGIGFSGLD